MLPHSAFDFVGNQNYIFLNLIIFAGFPPTIAKSGTSFVTTEQAPTIAPLPIF